MRRLMFEIYTILFGTSLALTIVYLQHDRAKFRRGRRYAGRHLEPVISKQKAKGRHRSSKSLGPFAPALALRLAAKTVQKVDDTSPQPVVLAL